MIESNSLNRLFFALWPDADTRAQISNAAMMLGIKMQHGGRQVAADNLHLTLAFLGSNISAKQEQAARQVGMVSTTAPLSIDLDIAQSFSERAKVWYLGSTAWPQELLIFRKALVGRLQKADVSFDHVKYTPHITVIRGPKFPLPPSRIQKIKWTAESFGLYRSRLNEPDKPYETIATWQLKEGEAGGQLEQLTLL